MRGRINSGTLNLRIFNNLFQLNGVGGRGWEKHNDMKSLVKGVGE